MSASSLERLPPELITTIVDHLSHDDRKALSLANSTIRTTTASSLFKGLKVDCPLPDNHIGETVVRKYGHHVLNLHLYVTFFPNKGKSEEEKADASGPEEEVSMIEDEDVDEEESDQDEEDQVDEKEEQEDEEAGDDEEGDEDELASDKEAADEGEEEKQEEGDSQKWYWTNPPESVWAHKATDATIVQNLIQFKGLPRCTILSLHTNGDENFEAFDEDWDDNDIGHDSIYFCCEPENWEEVKAKEEKYQWRAALRDMYHDIATLSKVEDLRILNFLPRKASSWRTTEWAEFLGRLRNLTLYPYGGDNGAGWQVNTLPGFNTFFDELSSTMLRHAKALETLKIVANEDGFLDCESLRLAPGIMPALRVLHVEYMAATSILTRFLVQESPALEEIHIVNCVAQDANRDGEMQPTWAQLWKMLRQKSIRVVYKRTKSAPLTDDEEFYDGEEEWVPPDDEYKDVKKLRKKLAQDPSLVVWPYAGPDHKYGFLSMNVEMNIENFEKGEDNLEYGLLVAEMRQKKGDVLMSED